MSLHSCPLFSRTAEAYDLLLSVVGSFQAHSTFSYYMAQYACRLGKFKEGKDWLCRAFEEAKTPKTRD